MSNGRNPGKGKKKYFHGQWVGIPIVVLRSTAYRSLTHAAKSLLLDVASQGPDRNGRLLLTRATLQPLGWRSDDSIQRAKNQLLAASLLVETVKGGRPNRASMYAMTWHDLSAKCQLDPGVRATFKRRTFENEGVTPPGGPRQRRTGPAGGERTTRAVPHNGTVQVDRKSVV